MFHRIAVVIHCAIAASLLAYIGVVEFLLWGDPLRGDTAAPGAVRYTCFAAALSLAVAVNLIRGILLQGKSGEDARVRLQRLQRASIFTTALCEVPAVLGLVLLVIGGSRTDFYALLALSAVMLAAYFPRLSPWQERWARP
jgi:hypothetical protein